MTETLAARIKVARDRHRLSQAKLAGRLGLTRAAVSRYEQGLDHPRAAVMDVLGRLFGCGPEWLEHGRGRPPVAPLFPGDVVQIGDHLIGIVMGTPSKRIGEQIAMLSVRLRSDE